jgi:hypothetical protein
MTLAANPCEPFDDSHLSAAWPLPTVPPAVMAGTCALNVRLDIEVSRPHLTPVIGANPRSAVDL